MSAELATLRAECRAANERANERDERVMELRAEVRRQRERADEAESALKKVKRGWELLNEEADRQTDTWMAEREAARDAILEVAVENFFLRAFGAKRTEKTTMMEFVEAAYDLAEAAAFCMGNGCDVCKERLPVYLRLRRAFWGK